MPNIKTTHGAKSVLEDLSASNPLTAEAQAALRELIAAEAEADVRAKTPIGLENPVCLPRIHNAIQILDRDVPGNFFGICGFGDSMVSTVYAHGFIIDDLAAIHGLGAVLSPGLGRAYNGQAAWVLAGGATKAIGDYTYDPGSNLITIPTGASATLVQPAIADQSLRGSGDLTEAKLSVGQNTPNMPDGIAKVKVFVIKEPGSGTITAKLIQTGYADVTASVTANAAAGLSVLSLVPANRAQAMTLVLTSAGGTVKLFGAAFLADRGVLYLSSGVGGSTMTSQSACLAGGAFRPAYAELLTELNIGMVLHQQRAAPDANYQSNYAAFFTAYEAQQLAQIVIAERPATESTPTTTEINTFLRAACRSRGIGFLDIARCITGNLLTELGWNADTAHNSHAANRYFATLFLDAVNRFQTAFGAFRPLMYPALLSRERFRLLALHEMYTTRIISRNGITADGVATAGGYTAPAATSEKGFRFVSAATLGHAAARIGILLGGGPNISTALHPLAITFKGYRNMSIKAGVRAFLIFGGGSATKTTLDGLNEKCFGIEMALGADVGSPLGYATEVFRMFICDGTTTNFSQWAPVQKPGASPPSNTGWSGMIRYDPILKVLFAYEAQGAAAVANVTARLRITMDATALHTGLVTAGDWCHAGIVAADVSNVPVAVGEVSWMDVSCSYGNLPHPYL